jgi:macrocin-O-methyltransferase TylF-like protien
MDLPIAWKVGLRRRLPWPLLNAILFRFPRLYETRLVSFESHLEGSGLKEIAEQLDLVRDVPGDIVECGCAHCGTSTVMARHLISRGIGKLVYACDSFEGFDPKELARERAAGLTTAGPVAFRSASYGYVQRKIAALGLEGRVIPVKGYFVDTLPRMLGPFSLGLIDCDLRDSIIFSAETIWSRLSPRGRLLFDDYTTTGFKGAREGVDLFVDRHRREVGEHGLLGRLYFTTKKN